MSKEISKTKAVKIVSERQIEILKELEKSILEKGLYDLWKTFNILDELETIKIRLWEYSK